MTGRPEWQKTMRGTPYIYQGEEIGMTNHGFTDISQYRDVESLNHFEILQKKGLTQADAYRILQVHSRDNGRTSMQKASSPIQILSFPIIRSLFVSKNSWNSGIDLNEYKKVIGNYTENQIESGTIKLRTFEAIVLWKEKLSQ